MARQLLIDTLLFHVEPSIITEGIQKDGTVEVYGPLQRAEIKNQNGRVYPRETLMRESKKYNDTFIKERRAFGELDHADDSVVHLKNTSHVITELTWKGNDLMGRVKILNTPAGNIVKELLRAGCVVGISSRALGSTKELAEGTVEVQDDLELIAWDFVSNPSTHGAFMSPVNESISRIQKVDYSNVDRIIREICCDMYGVCRL